MGSGKVEQRPSIILEIVGSGIHLIFCISLCFADGNEEDKMGSTVTAAVIGIVVPMGESDPTPLRRGEIPTP